MSRAKQFDKDDKSNVMARFDEGIMLKEVLGRLE
jgi:hypothetical protein